MLITLINPSPTKKRRFKIKSSKGNSMQSKLKKSIEADLKRWARSSWGSPKKGKGKRMAKKVKVARRKTTRKAVKRTSKIRRGMHRPVVIWSGKRFKRPKGSRLFPRPTRINPKRSHRRKSIRRNPLRLPLGMNRSLMAGLPVAGGIALSMFAMPQIAKYMPTSLKGQGKFFGIVYVAAGVAAMSFVKKDIAKVMGGTVLAMGLYDLIACNVPMLKLPPLPGRTAENGAFGSSYGYGADEVVGASFNEIGTDFAPSTMGSSYGEGVGDDIDYGGDSIEIG